MLGSRLAWLVGVCVLVVAGLLVYRWSVTRCGSQAALSAAASFTDSKHPTPSFMRARMWRSSVRREQSRTISWWLVRHCGRGLRNFLVHAALPSSVTSNRLPCSSSGEVIRVAGASCGVSSALNRKSEAAARTVIGENTAELEEYSFMMGPASLDERAFVIL